jgi:hypothetical protein
MIPVQLAPEPEAFDRDVRQKGLAAIDELVGRPSRHARRGPKRKPVARTAAEIPADRFPPYWRDGLEMLLEAYSRRCAFLALHLEHATGNPSVDHMLPKSRRWDQVYEWANYRLSAATINARKADLTGLVDPMECRVGWFALELVGFQVVRGPEAPTHLEPEINATLDLLNAPDCCRAREEYFTCYRTGEINYDYLCRRAPFVAQELRRQGELLPEDQ